MIYYRVKKNGHNRQVYTTSLNRKVSKHGYFSNLSYNELLTESEYKKVVFSGKASSYNFDRVILDRRKVVKYNSDRRYHFG